MSNTKGFTLIEMLLVISVIMIISLFNIHSFQSYFEQRKLDDFMEQLEEDLLLAQMLALANQKTSNVVFFDDVYTVNYYENNKNGVKRITRYYPDGIKVEFLTNSMGRTVYFLINGNVKEFGKFRVKYKKRKTTVVFQLGRGRFYFE